MKTLLLIMLLAIIPLDALAVVNVDCGSGATIRYKTRGNSETVILGGGFSFPLGTENLLEFDIPCLGVNTLTTSAGDPLIGTTMGRYVIAPYNSLASSLTSSVGWLPVQGNPLNDVFSMSNMYFLLGVICAVVFISGLKTVR